MSGLCKSGGNLADMETPPTESSREAALMNFNHAAGAGAECVTGSVAAPLSHTGSDCVKRSYVEMYPSQTSVQSLERLLTAMRVCHRLRQPMPPRIRMAQLVGCTTRQLDRYTERLKAEGRIALERGGQGVLVREIRP
jgi:hypothetical protein